MCFCLAISICFVGGLMAGKQIALYLFPLSGFFMSLVYPTFNSKGISCFPKNQHGTIAGVILFFTAAGAAFGPFVMGIVSDINGGDAKYGFYVASVFSVLLSVLAIVNLLKRPAETRLAEIERSEYGTPSESPSP
jgi:fucose permease